MVDRIAVEDMRAWAAPSGVRTAAALLLDVISIVGAALLAEHVGGWLPYLLTIPIIGARQHALYAVAHEAVHHGLAKNRKVNDWIGQIIGWMFLLDFQTYRRSHLAHHWHLNTPGDPDWARYNAPGAPLAKEYKFPTSPWRVASLLIGDLLGLRAYQLIAVVRRYTTANAGGKAVSVSKTRKSGNSAIVFYALMIALIYVIGWKPFVLYWVIPIFTWAKMNLRLRLIAEHYAVFGEDGSRSVETNWLERFFLWPHNTSFHAQHHAYPGVRFFRLPLLVDRLGLKWYEETGVARTRGLRGLLREITTTQAQQRPEADPMKSVA